MSKELKKTVVHGSIYAVGNILRRLVSFIMLPIYTRCLTPSDYGTLELLSMIIDFTSIVVGLRIGSAIFRFFSEYDNIEDKNEVISTSIILVSIINIIGVFFIIFFSKEISTLVFGGYDFRRFIVLFSFTLLFQASVEVALIYIRAQQRPWLFVGVSMLKLVLQLSLNIYFVVFKEMRIDGVIYSALISGAIIASILLLYTFYNVGIRFNSEKAKELISFSWPLILTSMLSFYLTFGDRYFLNLMHGLYEVGIYTLAYKFGFLLVFLVWHPFSNIWDTQKYEIYKKENAKEIYQNTFLIMNFVLIFSVVLLSVFIKDVLVIMSDSSFVPAYKVVPILLLAYLVQCWTAYCSFGILLEKKTIIMTQATLVAVIVISIGYFLLIPRFGVYGAAWATVAGFIARFIRVNSSAKQIYNMQLPWQKIFQLLVIAGVTYGLSLMVPPQFTVSIAARIILVILFVVVSFVLPIFDQKQKKTLLAFVKHRSPFWITK